MRVLIVFHETLHYGMASANRVYAYAHGLKANGAEVEVAMPFAFVTNPDAPFPQKGDFKGIKFCYMQYFQAHPKKLFWLPIAGLLYFWKQFYGKVKLLLYSVFSPEKVDVIHIYGFSTFFCNLLILLNRKKFITVELCEIPFFGLEGEEKIQKRKKREDLVFRKCGGIIAISDELEKYAGNYKPDSGGVIRIPILKTDEGRTDLTTTGAGSGSSYIVHTGKLTERKDGVVGMMKAFGLAYPKFNKPVKFKLTGKLTDSPVKEELQKLMAEYKLENAVEFTGFLEFSEVLSLQQNATLSIINKYSNEQNKYNFPTKLAEYMGFGLPVIVTDVGEMARILTHRENGIVVKEGDYQAMADEMVYLVNNPEEARRIGRNAKHFAEETFDSVRQGKLLTEYYSMNLKKTKTN